MTPTAVRAGAARHHPFAILAVDVIVFALEARRLEVLLVQVRDGAWRGHWAFPGGLVGRDEGLEAAAQRELSEQTGLAGIYLEQLRTFGDPGRDPSARVVSTAYMVLIPDRRMVAGGEKYAALCWRPIGELPALAYDHSLMAQAALERLRSRLEYTNIIYGLLAPEFTLGELQDAYEIILQRHLDRRNFRKRIIASGMLRRRGKQRRGRHRPAELYSIAEPRPRLIRMLLGAAQE